MRPLPRHDQYTRTFLQRRAELDEAHRRQPRRLRPFLVAWAQALLRAPRPARHEPPPTVAPQGLTVTYVGHSTVLLRYRQTTILTDPVLERFVLGIPRVRAPADAVLEGATVDLCLISHAHHDHLHLPSLARLPRTATLVVPPRCADLCSALGFGRVVELAVGEAIDHRGVEVLAVPARHQGSRSLVSWRRRGCCGYVVRGDGPTAYFAGDTGYFSGFVEVGRRHAPDLAILPIGAYRPWAMRQSHMSPLDALYAFDDLGARALLPVHHGTFPLSYEPLTEPAAWLEELAHERGLEEQIWLMEPGESRALTCKDDPKTAK